MAYVDLHSHVLPGLDDGSPDSHTSLAMLKGLSQLGFDTVCATPHQMSGRYLPERDAIESAYGQLTKDALDAGVPIRLELAAENMWDEVFLERCEQGAVPQYSTGPAFLVELPIAPSLPLGLFDHLFRLRSRGQLPVIAHPERYQPLWKDAKLREKLARSGAMI